MSKIRIYLRSLTANWVGLMANIVVSLCLTPFVVRTVGDGPYGVLTLLMVITGYLGLAELGVRVSTGRYINYYLGRGEPKQVTKVVNTSLVFYCFIGVIGFVLAGALGAVFGHLFPKVPIELVPDARRMLLLMAMNIMLGLGAGVFGQLLASADRFDLRNIATLSALAVRTAGTVIVLNRGHGIVALVTVQVCASVVAMILTVILARAKGVAVVISPRHANWRTFREVFHFGAWAFVGNYGFKLVYQTAAIVIGLLLDVTEVTFYEIGQRLIDYARMLVTQVVAVITPDIEKAGGRGDLAELRWLMVRTARMMMFLAVPLLVGLATMSEEFLILWMGPDKARVAWVVIILAIGQLASAPAGPCHGILMALGHVKLLAYISLAEGVANLVLGVTFVLVFDMGINGVALGALLPRLFFAALLKPIISCRRIKFSLTRYLREVTLRWVCGVALYAPICLYVARLDLGLSWSTFLAKVAFLIVVYLPIGLCVLGLEQARTTARRLGLPIGAAADEPKDSEDAHRTD